MTPLEELAKANESRTQPPAGPAALNYANAAQQPIPALPDRTFHVTLHHAPGETFRAGLFAGLGFCLAATAFLVAWFVLWLIMAAAAIGNLKR